MTYIKIILTIIAFFIAVGTVELYRIHDVLFYDFRPEVRCINNNTFDCPVEKGGVLVINEGEQK